MPRYKILKNWYKAKSKKIINILLLNYKINVYKLRAKRYSKNLNLFKMNKMFMCSNKKDNKRYKKINNIRNNIRNNINSRNIKKRNNIKHITNNNIRNSKRFKTKIKLKISLKNNLKNNLNNNRRIKVKNTIKKS